MGKKLIALIQKLLWLPREAKCRCERPQWYVTIEHYPTCAWDKWRCRRCCRSQDFPNDQPPVRISEEICNLGHLHIVNTGAEELGDVLEAEIIA